MKDVLPALIVASTNTSKVSVVKGLRGLAVVACAFLGAVCFINLLSLSPVASERVWLVVIHECYRGGGSAIAPG